MVMMNSLLAADSAGEDATQAPTAASGSVLFFVLFHTATS